MNLPRLGFALPALFVACSACAGTTRVASVIYSPDITLDLAGQVTASENAALDDRAGNVTVQDIGAIPRNAKLTAYHRFDNGDQLLAFDITQPDPMLDQLSPMIEVLPGELVVASEKRPPHTSGDDMKEPGLVRRSNLAAWISHSCSVACGTARRNRKIARHQVGLLLDYLSVLD